MKITFIGSGKVAHHLAQQFFKAGFDIVEIYSRRKKNAIALSRLVKAIATRHLFEINTHSDIYICAISDDVIQSIAQSLEAILPADTILAHTSGVHGYDIFPAHFKYSGTFYPLQTFSKNIPVDFTSIPILIDARYASTKKKLTALAASISQNTVVGLKKSEKEQLHLAAVFVNNFSNHMFSIGQQICAANRLDFDLLKPLIKQTANKLDFIPPSESQTGPAARGDFQTIEKHLRLLESHPEWEKIYSIISKNIGQN
jgi:predicted short-subunit dehydrogenase-like oxidoreductase (DUF2520 family)